MNESLFTKNVWYMFVAMVTFVLFLLSDIVYEYSSLQLVPVLSEKVISLGTSPKVIYLDLYFCCL